MQCVKGHCKPLIAGSTQSSQLCDLRRKFMRLQLIDSTFANSSGRQFWWRRTSPSTDTNQRNFWLRPPCQIAAERSPAKLAIGLINHELSRLAAMSRVVTLTPDKTDTILRKRHPHFCCPSHAPGK